MVRPIYEFENIIKYRFKNKELINTALTHKSFAFETGVKTCDYNERLEFLGDAILEHVISEKLFLTEGFLSEGQMSKNRAAIVCEASLSMAMKSISGDKFIKVGKCEGGLPIKEAIIADAFEAVIGAIYLDSDYDNTKTIVLGLLDKQIDMVLKGEEFNVDYKTRLQEKLQVNGNVKIEYIVSDEILKLNDRKFKVELYCNGKKIGEGIGKNKKQAEQQAAKKALGNKY